MNILFTCVGRRSYLVKYFKDLKEKYSVCLFGCDMQESAPALQEVDVPLIVKSVYDKDYISDLINIVKQNKIDLLISLNDLELPLLAKNKSTFNEFGCTVVVSDPDVIDICFDKYATYHFLKENNIKTPKTFISYDACLKALNNGDIDFPLVVKPRWGSGSIGVEFVENKDELFHVYSFQKSKLRRTILANASLAKIDEAILIQEKVGCKEYGLDIINDFNADFSSVIIKEKLAMRAGETDKAKIVSNDKLTDLGCLIGHNLKHMGNLDCDVLYHKGEYYVLEMNPRFGGGYPFSHMAGANIPQAYYLWCKGSSVEKEIFSVENDVVYSKCDTLLKVENTISKRNEN